MVLERYTRDNRGFNVNHDVELCTAICNYIIAICEYFITICKCVAYCDVLN